MFGHLADTHPQEEWSFIGTSPPGAIAASSEFQEWLKPKGVKFVGFKLHGSGAGGGNGFTRTAGSAGGGGGGGGSGAMVNALFRAEHLPNVLYILSPRGGNAASVGGRAWVMLEPGQTTAAFALLCSGAADAAAGGTGTGAAAGALGAAGTVATLATASWAYLAMYWYASAGFAGVAGGAQTGAVGASVTPAGPMTGGAGGAGCTTTDFAGGTIAAFGRIRTAPAASSTPGGEGLPGLWLPSWMLSTGGNGGASNNSGTGGKGGDGGPGSGGAGGGAGATGGAGGVGGPANVQIFAW